MLIFYTTTPSETEAYDYVELSNERVQRQCRVRVRQEKAGEGSGRYRKIEEKRGSSEQVTQDYL